MQTFSFEQNEEDKRIRDAINNFDFQRFGVPSGNVDFEMRESLFTDVLRSIGNCANCTAFNPKTCYCSTLKTSTKAVDRCSDFELLEEEETESPFEVMVKGYEHLVYNDATKESQE